jgi:hypothetical protein
MIHNSEGCGSQFRLYGPRYSCSSVTWFAVLRNFERMKNGPARAKSLGPFLLLTASTALHVR